MHYLLENSSLCSLAVAFIGFITALLVAFIGWRSALSVARISLKAESKRLIGFHKLEIYENAIEEINYLVPLYHQLWHEAYEKRSPEEIMEAIPALRKTINTILEYQKSHNAIGKAQVYSEALKGYVPFIANPVCIDYIRQLDSIEEIKTTPPWVVPEKPMPKHIMEMYLLDELGKYGQYANQLKEEIENLNLFEREKMEKAQETQS